MSDTTDQEREELKKRIADALHVTWAFDSNKFKGFSAEKIQVLDMRGRGYHTSYKDFVNNMADFILARDAQREVEVRIDELEHTYGCDGERYTYSNYEEQLGEITILERIDRLKAKLPTPPLPKKENE